MSDMYHFAMCGTCPARASWYFQSTDRAAVEAWAHQHTAAFGHGVTLGKAPLPFCPACDESPCRCAEIVCAEADAL